MDKELKGTVALLLMLSTGISLGEGDRNHFEDANSGNDDIRVTAKKKAV